MGSVGTRTTGSSLTWNKSRSNYGYAMEETVRKYDNGNYDYYYRIASIPEYLLRIDQYTRGGNTWYVEDNNFNILSRHKTKFDAIDDIVRMNSRRK